MAVVLAVAVLVGLLAAGGSGRPIEIAVLVIAVAVGGATGWPASGHAALGAAAAYLIVETLAGRLDASHLPTQLLLTAGLLGTVLAAGFARGEREPKPRPMPMPVPVPAAPALARATPQPKTRKVETWIRERVRAPRLPPGTLEYEVERARRTERPMSVLAIRPDDPRSDTQVPAQFLELIEDAIAGSTRAVDLVNRAVGRFDVVLPDTDAEGARTAAERIRLRIDSTRPEEGVGVSVSIGVATYPQDGSDDVELAAAAGRALERASELGGNRTVLYSVPAGAPRGWGLVP